MRAPVLLLLSLYFSTATLFAQTKWEQRRAEADTLFLHQEYEKAGELYTKLIDHSGLKSKDDYDLVFKRGFCYYVSNKFDLALNDLNAVVAARPESTRARILRSFVYKSQGETGLQLADLNYAINNQPQRPDLFKWRAAAFLEKESYDSARSDLLAARRLADDGEIEASLGVVYYNLQMPDSALMYLNKAIELEPSAIAPYLYAASFCMEAQEYELAIKYLNVALSVEPNQTTALFYKGVALVESDRTDEGCRCLTKAFQSGEDDAADYLRDYCYSSSD